MSEQEEALQVDHTAFGSKATLLASANRLGDQQQQQLARSTTLYF
jgi:hypothetical protein